MMYLLQQKTPVILLAFILLFLTENASYALSPTITIDSARHCRCNPKTAILCSAILPGMGQVYNRKYWKVPLIYGAGGAVLYSFNYYHTLYKKTREASDEGDVNKKYNINGRAIDYDKLYLFIDHYGDKRDLSIVGLVAVYFLNVIDAMVDAYFTGFDVSDELSLNIRPAVFNNNYKYTAAIGLKLSIGF